MMTDLPEVTAETLTNERIIALGEDPASSLKTKAWCIAATRVVRNARQIAGRHRARERIAAIINARAKGSSHAYPVGAQ